MLGWNISVFRQLEGGSSPAKADSAKGTRVAVWQAGPEGLRWINELVTMGLAVDLGGDGYPLRYTAQAEHLIPPILEGPPKAQPTWQVDDGDVLTSAWVGKTAVGGLAADDYRPDEWLWSSRGMRASLRGRSSE